MEQKVFDIKKYGCNIFVLGDDYKETFKQMPEYKEVLNLGCKVVFFERTPDISTTKIKQGLQMLQDKK